MSHHFAAPALEVSGRLAQGLAMGHFAVQDFFRAVEQDRRRGVDAVSELVHELAHARQQATAAQAEAVAAQAETARLRRELASCARAIGAERERADRAEHALAHVVEAVRRRA